MEIIYSKYLANSFKAISRSIYSWYNIEYTEVYELKKQHIKFLPNISKSKIREKHTSEQFKFRNSTKLQCEAINLTSRDLLLKSKTRNAKYIHIESTAFYYWRNRCDGANRAIHFQKYFIIIITF